MTADGENTVGDAVTEDGERATFENTVTILELPKPGDDFTRRVATYLRERHKDTGAQPLVGRGAYCAERVRDIATALGEFAKVREGRPVDYVDIVGHGGRGRLCVGKSSRSPSTYVVLTTAPDVLAVLGAARDVLEKPPYHPGTVVRLVGCMVGAPRLPDDQDGEDGTLLLHAVSSTLGRRVHATTGIVSHLDFADGFYSKTEVRKCWADTSNGTVTYEPPSLAAERLPAGPRIAPGDLWAGPTGWLPGAYTFREIATRLIEDNMTSEAEGVLLNHMVELYDDSACIELQSRYPSMLVARSTLGRCEVELSFSVGGELALVTIGSASIKPRMYAFALREGGFADFRKLASSKIFPRRVLEP